jgi:DNA-binding MarR family transcriptional regulator
MDSEWTDDDGTGEQPVVWKPIPPASSNLNPRLRDAHRAFAKGFGRFLKETGIIASEWAALRELYRPQCWSPVELGFAIGMSKGGASKLVSRLVVKGLVVKRKQESDLRFRSVGLTRHGRELVVFLASIEKDTDREYFGPLGNGRRFRLGEYMKRLLISGRGRRMHQWVAIHLRNIDFEPFTPAARARSSKKAQIDADELWKYFQQVADAAARGQPHPPMPEALR